ncbi:hypothetical protein M6B38_239690 [Iris pallida]|uniref:RNase H type-1 domain-containing protein n=1 Tax=Iris pallida TaxID=29817 RepID=A0AAX6DKY3_IRIPA|nr:hypothetical protein M6B38_239690 [Iris pallida]
MDSRAGTPAIGRLPADARNQLHPARPPSNTGVRLSVHGCCGGDGGTAGGGIVRDHGGQMVVAFYIFRTADMATDSDIDGLLYGLLLCQSHNKDINSIDISSQRLANILNSRAKTPWALTYSIRKIRVLTQNVTINYTASRQNGVAQALCHLAKDSKDEHIFFHSVDLPHVIVHALAAENTEDRL